ncbi:hypothetical protein [Absidia glauca]|uniref:Uncharacterized protein n=1 Tax=Absidia glauca TaxID=4829 RepID=A0A168N4F9_ABSGL|nr:hypothetical protein [Absidia glauca]
MISMTQSLIRPAITMSQRAALANSGNAMRRVYLSTEEDGYNNQPSTFTYQHDHHHQVAPLTSQTIYAAANEDILKFDELSAPFHPTVNAIFDE